MYKVINKLLVKRPTTGGKLKINFMKWIIIIVFNLVFGLASGYIATRIFNHRGFSTNPEDNIKQWQKEKKDIVTIAFSTLICGIICFWLFDKNSSNWMAKGFIFGNVVFILSVYLNYLRSQAEELILRPGPGIVINSKLEFITELFRTVSYPGTFWLTMISLFYGYISLLIPIGSILWGYIMYRHLIK
jgi:hypothetical protein